MLHHIHVLKKTEVTDQINFEEFYQIITAPRRYWWSISTNIISLTICFCIVLRVRCHS